jgi:hypothetical protein
MPTLYITELANVGADTQACGVAAPRVPPLNEQTINLTGSSTPSAPWGPNTRYVMLNTDTACYLAWGPPTPVVPGPQQRMGANETRFYGVIAGQMLAAMAGS